MTKPYGTVFMKTRLLIALIFSLGWPGQLFAQYGCTDPLATNYNAAATINDGSCVYNPATITPASSIDLSDTVAETSGLILWDNRLITCNDNSDTDMYIIDAVSGAITEKYAIAGVVNTDWEELSQDQHYIYIGDFGNNVNGNRTDLHILKIAKSGLANPVTQVDTIRFTYEDQSAFTPAGENNTDFDCEAFFVSADSIFLLTKQWVSQKTSLYALPKVPGSYTARLKTTWNVNGLVTGAVYLEDKRLIALSGYSKLLQPFLYLLYDFQGHDYFGGNKRKLSLSLPFHQTEGITTADGLKYFVSNEHLEQPPLLDIKQQLHTIDLSPYLQQYLTGALAISNTPPTPGYIVFPNPATDHITVMLPGMQQSLPYSILDSGGRIVVQGSLSSGKTIINTAQLRAGMYCLMVNNSRKTALKIVKK